jgi:hypothetical protein
MGTWSTAIIDLRTLLSDGSIDRYSSRKRCFGEINGINTTFKTFEFRRITDFTTAIIPQGVYIDGMILPATGISADYINTGEFVLNPSFAPSAGSIVEASYYTQWFLDSELDDFLKTASNWISSQNDYTVTPSGLQPCILKYAAAEAYLKMALRWRTFLSEMYRVEDQPHKPGTAPSDEYTKMSETFREQALKARDEYYTRQGRSLQPLFGSVLGNIRQMPSGGGTFQ